MTCVLRQELTRRIATMQCARPLHAAPVTWASDNDDTQVAQLSPIAKNLEKQFASVDRPAKNLDKQFALMDEPAEGQDARAAMEAQPVKLPEPVKDETQPLEQVPKTELPTAAKDEEPKAVTEEKEPDVDPFHSSSNLSREAQMAARDAMREDQPDEDLEGGDGGDDDDGDDAAGDEEAVPKKRPAAKTSKPKSKASPKKPKCKASPKGKAKKAAPKGKAKAKAKASAKGRAKAKKKASPKALRTPKALKKGESGSDAEEEEEEAMETPSKRRPGCESEKDVSAEAADGTTSEHEVAAEEGTPQKTNVKVVRTKPAKNGKSKDDKGNGKVKGKPEKKDPENGKGKATFARRYQPMKCAWASQRWLAIRSSFQLLIEPKLKRPSSLEEPL